MGKVYRHLFPQIHDWDNLLLAWRKARRGKRGQPPAESNREGQDNVEQVRLL